MPLRALLLLLLLVACNLVEQPPQTPALPPAAAQLTVAWVENGDLFSWQQRTGETRRIASGGVVRPLVAPDGQHIAFTRGPQGSAESLWVVDVDGTAEQEIAARGDIRPVSGGRPLIGQVGWLDTDTLYFNTVAQTDSEVSARDDLYRAEIRTREIALILPPSEGGRFTFSPDRQHIIVVYPGTYGRRDGRIRVLDPLGQRQDNLLFFIGISSGASFPFYPEIFWLPDSSAALAAIPDADLLYDEFSAPPTLLWRLPIANPSDRAVIGNVQASFFGLPRWSSGGDMLLYMRRAENASDNTFELYVAESGGENAQLYASGEAGSLQPPLWLSGGESFVFQQEDVLWLGSRNAPPQRLPNEGESALLLVFAGADIYVFAAFNSAGAAELRYASVSALGQASTLVATLGAGVPAFDAALSD